MKHIFAILLLLCLTLTSCTQNLPDPPNEKITEGAETTTPPVSTPPPLSEIPSIPRDSYDTKELSRDENYKLMEMYVYDDNGTRSRRISFELPVEWHGDSSVFTNGEDYQYTLKVDMCNVLSATRDDVLAESSESNHSINILSENIYSTENYEIFQYECTSSEGEASRIFIYYLYANGERLHISSYVFGEYIPEYEEIFKRIIESVQF